MVQKLLTVFISFSLLISSTVFAAKPTPSTQTTPRKQKLVLMPIIVSSEDMRLRGQMETALVEGLQEKYIVFSGDNVLQKQREAFAKESREAKGDCDQTKCMQNIAESFASELVAVAHVTKQDGGYFLSINIQNIFDEKVVYSKSLAYENQTAFQVINSLKFLTGAKETVATQSLPQDSQKQDVLPQKSATSEGIFFDKKTGLTWQDNEEAKTVQINWQGAKDYCENLTLGGRSDWHLPTKEELTSLSTLGFYGEYNDGWKAWYDANKGKQVNGLFNNPTLKNTSFAYWSSSLDVSDSASAWLVFFGSGHTHHFAKRGSANVRCVRR